METSLTATQTPTIDTPRRKYLSLQAGRAIAALLVVLHHVSSFIGTEPHLWIHPRIGRWLAGPSLGIAFFFVLSGTVILTAHWNDIGNPASLRSYLRKRLVRIYPIYWFVLVLVLWGQLRLPGTQYPLHHDPWVILSSVLLVHIHSSETNLVVAWTLFHELAFYAMFAAVLLHKRIGLCLLTLWFAVSLINIPRDTPAHSPSFFTPVHLLFACGLFAAWLLQRQKVPYPHLLFVLGTLFFFAVLGYSGKVGYPLEPIREAYAALLLACTAGHSSWDLAALSRGDNSSSTLSRLSHERAVPGFTRAPVASVGFSVGVFAARALISLAFNCIELLLSGFHHMVHFLEPSHRYDGCSEMTRTFYGNASR